MKAAFKIKPALPPPHLNEQLLKRTTSRCPVCQRPCPAEVWRAGGNPAKVFLRRTCAIHGDASICIASDARFYWLALGNPQNAGSCSAGPQAAPANVQLSTGRACCAADGAPAGTLGRNAGRQDSSPFETLSTCLALIEIVHSCNLACPTCYADSPLGTGQNVDAVPLPDLQRRIQDVIDRKGPIEILQLSGGEPTLHPQFFELLEWARSNPGIEYLLLNTNGVRIATDREFARRLAEMFEDGGLQLYLQFDGVQFEGQHWLRGADLRAIRRRALECCAELNVPVTLAMTVIPGQVRHLWAAIEFGLRYPHVHGITFQPMFGSGRLPKLPMGGTSSTSAPTLVPTWKAALPETEPALPHLNTADIILAAVEQSDGKLRFEDFTPLPCGDPNCATIGYLIRANHRTYSVSDFMDFSELQGFLQDKVHYTLEDLGRCGCECEPLGALLKDLEIKSSMAFRIMIKPFMDAWSWDQDRIDRCCTHVIRPDGKLDSFCRYYSGFPDCRAAP
jgi:uncharacterized radical SAM superfamily Fe-S cluster-containing enzyme